MSNLMLTMCFNNMFILCKKRFVKLLNLIKDENVLHSNYILIYLTPIFKKYYTYSSSFIGLSAESDSLRYLQ